MFLYKWYNKFIYNHDKNLFIFFKYKINDNILNKIYYEVGRINKKINEIISIPTVPPKLVINFATTVA